MRTAEALARGLVVLYVALLAVQDALAVLGVLALASPAEAPGWLAWWGGRAVVEAAAAVALARGRGAIRAGVAALLVLSMASHLATVLENPRAMRTGRLLLHGAAVVALAGGEVLRRREAAQGQRGSGAPAPSRQAAAMLGRGSAAE